MKLGFVGLGQMGRPIAANLLRGDASLVVSDRSDRWFAEFRSKGATGSTDLADMAAADVIFLCLPSSAAVEGVLLGEGGLFGHLGQGQAVVDLSTITYATTLAIGRAAEAKGVAFLDAPISGMEARAVDATLTVMCGGAPETFDRVKPLLGLIGNKILHMGPTRSGQLTKLDQPAAVRHQCRRPGRGAADGGVKMGLDPDLVGEVVNSGTGRSYASEFFIPRILRGHFSDGYPMSHAYKDLVSGAELSADSVHARCPCSPPPPRPTRRRCCKRPWGAGQGRDDPGVRANCLVSQYRSRKDTA